MSSAHKAALARGREEGRAVRRYLEAIERNRPRRGRKRTPESVRKRLAVVDERLAVGRSAGAPAPAPGEGRPPGRAGPVVVERRPGHVGEGLRQGGQGLRAAQGHRVQRLARRRGERGRAPARRDQRGRRREARSGATAGDGEVGRARGPQRARAAEWSQTEPQAGDRAWRRATRRLEQAHAVGGRRHGVTGPLGMGHEAHHVAVLVAHPGDVVDRPVGVGACSAGRCGPRRAGARGWRRRR